MKKPFLIFLIFFAAVQILYSEKNYTSERVVFLPQEFYVGDLVEMRVVITPEAGAEVRRPEQFPDSYWVKIENAEVYEHEGEYELRVFLRPYAPGIRTLPAIQFGDILLRDIRIRTESVLSGDPPPFAPPADQMFLPGTKYYIALVVGLVFLLPVFFIFFWTKIRKAISYHLYERKRRRPYRKLIRVLRELKEQMASQDGREFYTVLMNEFRSYLTERSEHDYKSATVREASAMIADDIDEIASLTELVGLFCFADEVKFGERQVTISKRERDLELVRKASTEMEETAGGRANVDF